MTEPLAPEELAAIRARVDAATPGPWACLDAIVHVVGTRHVIADCADYHVRDRENGAFISAARADVPRLLDALESVRADLRDVNAYVATLGDRVAQLEDERRALGEELDELRARTAVAVEQLRGPLSLAGVQTVAGGGFVVRDPEAFAGSIWLEHARVRKEALAALEGNNGND